MDKTNTHTKSKSIKSFFYSSFIRALDSFDENPVILGDNAKDFILSSGSDIVPESEYEKVQ